MKKNCSIFNNFCTIGLLDDITKSPQCTSAHKGLFKGTKSILVWGDLNMTNKTINLS